MSLIAWPRRRRPEPVPAVCGHGEEIAALEKRIAGLRAQIARQMDQFGALELQLTKASRDRDDTQKLLDATIDQVAAEQQETRLAAERLAVLEQQSAARIAVLERAVELADADRDAHDTETRRLAEALRGCAEDRDRLQGLLALQQQDPAWPDGRINNESTTGGN